MTPDSIKARMREAERLRGTHVRSAEIAPARARTNEQREAVVRLVTRNNVPATPQVRRSQNGR